MRNVPTSPCGLAITLLMPLLCALTTLASAQDLPSQVTLPLPTGPYAVGREAFDWTDETRLDPFAPERDTIRSLTGYIWYPAVATSAAPAPYVPKEILAALAQQANPAAAALARQYTVDQANVTAHAISNAPMPSGNGRFPVLLMKPGRGGLVLQYASLAEDLASHGYIVAASDSPYTTPVVVHLDGRIVIKNAKGSPSESALGNSSEFAPGQPNDLGVPVVEAWAADDSFVLDRLGSLNADRNSRFYRRLDLRAVGAFGHSMGGAASLQFCKHDNRCRASANLDGALWGDIALGGLRTPALFIFSDRPMLDQANPDNANIPLVAAIDRIRAGLPNSQSLVVMQGTRHYNFADSALLNDPAFARSMDMLGPIEPLRGIELTRKLLLAFFDRNLKKIRSAHYPDDPELRFRREPYRN